MPCRIVFAKAEDHEAWPNHLNYRFLAMVRSSPYSPMATRIILRTSSFVKWSLYEIFKNLRWHLTLKTCVLFSSSAVKVHDSQTCRYERTRKRISFTFESRDVLFSVQAGFSFVKAAVACAILERTSGFEPSFETTALRHLKLVTVLSFCPFTLISRWMSSPLFCHQLSLLSTDLRLMPCAGFVQTFN